jgi:hypothetical protein
MNARQVGKTATLQTYFDQRMNPESMAEENDTQTPDSEAVNLHPLVSLVRAKDRDEAFGLEEKWTGKPHGWIQWKGTDVCMDIHCECGAHLHIDADFLYEVRCPYCEQAYAVNGHVQLIPIQHASEMVKTPEKDDDDLD